MHTILAIYFVTLFYAFHYALPLYTESLYLGSIVPLGSIGIIYSIAAIISFGFTLRIGVLLNKWSNRKVLMGSAFLEAISLIVLAYSTSVILSIVAFVAHIILLGILYIGLNILVESVSKDTDTGKVRGIYLTILNLGILTGPFLASQTIGTSFKALFISAALCMIPFIYILYRHLDHLHEDKYLTPNIIESLAQLKEFKNIRIIVFVQYVLELFWVIMVIYTPLYLIQNNILNLETYLGVVVPIILLPFIFIPYPFGYLADKKIGEKELLIIGILFMVLGTTIFISLTVSILAFYIFALFIARLGSSIVEEMSSSYFYKQVSPYQANLISIFVNTRNIALITGPLIGSILIYTFSLPIVFFALIGILVLSLLPIIYLHDTK